VTGPRVSDSLVTSGSLLIAGGALIGSSHAIFRTLTELAGGGRIAVFGTASSEPARVAALAVSDIVKAGGIGVALEVTPRTSSDPALLEELRSCAGLWFEGGDQRRITDAFTDTPALEVIRERFHAGAVIGGTSAGAAMMGGVMIADGSSLEALQRGAATLETGLGFLRGAITDQHFSQRGRFARLMLALLHTGADIGIGVDEDTALLIPPSGAWQIIGSSSVTLFEQRDGRLSVSQLRQGDSFDSLTNTLQISSLSERSTLNPSDLLEPNAFKNLLEDFTHQPRSRLERVIQVEKSRWKLTLQKTSPLTRSVFRIALSFEQ